MSKWTTEEIRSCLADPSEMGSYRNDGPATMFEGARAVGPFVETMHDRVVKLFEESRPDGLTDPEMLTKYNERHHPDGEKAIYRSVSTRRRELVVKGVLRDSGRTRVNPKSGIRNIVWERVPANV